MQKLLISILFFMSLWLGACSIYKPPVQQGNFYTQEMVERLRIGMKTSQVKQIMGSPMLVDGFDRNRWTYYYRLTVNGELKHEYRLILTFDRGRLAKIEGEAPPAALLRQ